jgi:hypothetical protein
MTVTPALPQTITEPVVDQYDGARVVDAALRVRHIVQLGCTCLRYECDRPGGGRVHVFRGEHCLNASPCSPARSSPPTVPEFLSA